MDDIDRKILAILQIEDKTPQYQIAAELGIGTSTVHYRIQKMIESGIIKRFAAIVDPEKVGYPTTAWLGLGVDPLRMKEIASVLAGYDETQIVSTCTGEHDIVVQVVAKSEKELWKFINEKVKTIGGIEKGFDVSTFLTVFKSTHLIQF